MRENDYRIKAFVKKKQILVKSNRRENIGEIKQKGNICETITNRNKKGNIRKSIYKWN